MSVQESGVYDFPEHVEKLNVHCGEITTDLTCAVCGRWLVEVFSD